MISKEITWHEFKDYTPEPYFNIIVQDHEGNFAIGNYMKEGDLFVQNLTVPLGKLIMWAHVIFKLSKYGDVQCVHENGEEIKFSDIYDFEDLFVK